MQKLHVPVLVSAKHASQGLCLSSKLLVTVCFAVLVRWDWVYIISELTNVVIIIRYFFFCVVFTCSMSCRSPGWFLYDTFTLELDRSSLRFGLHVFQFVQDRIIISKSSKQLEIFIIIWFSLAGTWLGRVGNGFVLVILKYYVISTVFSLLSPPAYSF